MPLPPYIKRDDTAADRERYQTVFAASRGSVAAPTAGLHFTRGDPRALDGARRRARRVTLHVGYGTFKPVRVDEVEAHVVDPEPYEISADAAAAINRALDERRRVVAVGTTTTRALEDAAIRGGGRVRAGAAEATTFIYPGFDFQVVGGLLTNFHLPQSSLLMLVVGVRRARAGARRLSRGGRAPLPLLQLRRRDADSVSCQLPAASCQLADCELWIGSWELEAGSCKLPP